MSAAFARRGTGLLTALVAALLLAGCSTGAAAPGEPETPSEDGTVSRTSVTEPVTVGQVPIGELAGVDSELRVGEEISVLIDTPDLTWTVVNSDPEVLEVVDSGAGEAPRIVRIVAVAAGSSEVVFTGAASEAAAADAAADGAEDRIAVTVTEG
ncbi:hypothetical protein MUN76_12655 [Leucobacter rhizosphaerae]|uniref:Uncharacterized protein n=1 Tax=Leucobacter rhizosphaerae TaxID=2932245 RepID=A0ABY4FUA2_9MICO|nr:hypothetical protein [Leucobacter rhizosphaerae]UOQ59886.1 hypothetical protein MUN76_12655 [Leucobacter rhizosphaerae]